MSNTDLLPRSIEKNTLNIDLYWDEEENERRSDLYVEAYRCWNDDVWMRRDDLLTPTAYAGWQAVDSSTIKVH
jgi:hypothetical protein